MRPTLAAKPFSNPAWLFEPKWDGWRTLCFFRDGKAHLLARRLNNSTSKACVMKRKASVYAFAPCRDWLKVKTTAGKMTIQHASKRGTKWKVVAMPKELKLDSRQAGAIPKAFDEMYWVDDNGEVQLRFEVNNVRQKFDLRNNVAELIASYDSK
jgi:hypothetical protein